MLASKGANGYVQEDAVFVHRIAPCLDFLQIRAFKKKKDTEFEEMDLSPFSDRRKGEKHLTQLVLTDKVVINQWHKLSSGAVIKIYYRGADNSLAWPGRKQATATKL